MVFHETSFSVHRCRSSGARIPATHVPHAAVLLRTENKVGARKTHAHMHTQAFLVPADVQLDPCVDEPHDDRPRLLDKR